MVTDQVELSGFFQVGDEKERAGSEFLVVVSGGSVLMGSTPPSQQPEGVSYSSYDPKPYGKDESDGNDDKKFQILRLL